ncbi:MAG: RNA polymerase sigma-70 factor [Bacteroidota bacterium]
MSAFWKKSYPINLNNSRDFEEFYKSTRLKLFRIAFQLVGDKEIAQGLVQDIFCDIWSRREKLVIHLPLEAYAVQAVKFSCFNYMKKKVRRENAMQEFSAQEPILHNITEEKIYAEELQSAINHLLRSLPQRCREVFYLKREKFMSNKEIASRLNISEKTVERHMTRALNLLRVGLK